MFAPAGSAASPAAQTDRTLTLKQNTLTPMSKQSPYLPPIYLLDEDTRASARAHSVRPPRHKRRAATAASTWRSRRPDTGAEILTYW